MPKRSTLAKRVTRLEKNNRPEVKFAQFESGAFDTVGSVSGTLLRPQQLLQGTGRNNRIGDKVKSRNIRFQALLKMPDSPSSTGSCAVRILVLRSKIQNPSTSDMPSWYGVVDEDKFFVLRDILTNVSSITNAGSVLYGTTINKQKYNVKTGMRKLQYDGASFQAPLNNEVIIYMLAENQNAEVAYNYTHYYLDN